MPFTVCHHYPPSTTTQRPGRNQPPYTPPPHLFPPPPFLSGGPLAVVSDGVLRGARLIYIISASASDEHAAGFVPVVAAQTAWMTAFAVGLARVLPPIRTSGKNCTVGFALLVALPMRSMTSTGSLSYPVWDGSCHGGGSGGCGGCGCWVVRGGREEGEGANACERRGRRKRTQFGDTRTNVSMYMKSPHSLNREHWRRPARG